MPVYFVTGKLGSGKTLVSIGKIRDKLNSGCKVATNIDLNLHKLISIKSKNCVVYRIPDKPVLADLEAIGKGTESYDEDQNGILVLDECGTWFNSRSWVDKSRQEVLNWFLHARKLGWDIIFLVQDISIVDKQARETLAEFVVYCKRLDRVSIPLVTFLFRVAGFKVTFPKVHLAIVKYGYAQSSPVVERWLYTGRNLYHAYDTKQAFSNYYENSVYQVLPPYYSHYRYIKPFDPVKLMRMTKIYWKRFNRPFLLFSGVIIGFILSITYVLNDLVTEKKQTSAVTAKISPDDFQNDQLLLSRFTGSRITGYSKLGDFENYRIMTPDLKLYTSVEIVSQGLQLEPIDSCQLIIKKGNASEKVSC